MRRLTLVIVVLGWALVPGPALAQGPGDGVFVDPDSPAGVEYAIPFETAREQGSAGRENPPRAGDGGAGGRSSASGRGSAPLFGSGIGPPGTGASGSEGRSDEGGSGGAEGSDPGGSTGNADPDDADAGTGDSGRVLGPRADGSDSASPEPTSEARVSDSWDPLGSPWAVGAASLVLVLGALAGLLGRKLRRGPT